MSELIVATETNSSSFATEVTGSEKNPRVPEPRPWRRPVERPEGSARRWVPWGAFERGWRSRDLRPFPRPWARIDRSSLPATERAAPAETSDVDPSTSNRQARAAALPDARTPRPTTEAQQPRDTSTGTGTGWGEASTPGSTA